MRDGRPAGTYAGKFMTLMRENRDYATTHLDEATPRGWCPFWTPDAALGPADATLYLHGTQRNPYYRSPADRAAACRGVRLCTRPRCRGWNAVIRRHEEAGPGGH